MPGSKNGSSLSNAFEWDHSMHPQGLRVYGRIDVMPGFNQDDWWELKLTQGVTYTIQTRTPTNFDTILTLYDWASWQWAVDDDSGDDGAPLSKITFTPTTTGDYYIKVSNKLWAAGTYTLECSPVPGMYWASWAAVGGRHDVVEPPPPAVGVGSRFSSHWDYGPLTRTSHHSQGQGPPEAVRDPLALIESGYMPGRVVSE